MIFDGILNHDPVPVSARAADVPPRLQDVISKALEKDRDLRFQSAAEIRAELKRIKRDAGSGRAAASSGPAATHASSASGQIGAPALHSSGTAPAQTRRPRALWALGLVATLALLAAGGFWAYRRFAADASRPLDVTSMQVTRLTQSGNASAVALSPDGRYVIYALREDEKQSLWVRQVATRSDVQVLAGEVCQLPRPLLHTATATTCTSSAPTPSPGPTRPSIRCQCWEERRDSLCAMSIRR